MEERITPKQRIGHILAQSGLARRVAGAAGTLYEGVQPSGEALRQALAGLGLWLRHRSQVFAIFFGWRLALGALAFWAGALVAAWGTRNGVAPYQPPVLEPWQERLLGVWSHWDGEWFLHIARVGYLPQEPSAPFFPLYPLLIRAVALPLGGNYLLAGVVLSGLLALVAMLLLFELVKHDFSRTLGLRTVLYLAAFPASFFLTAIYSESLFLALTLGAFLAARRYSNWPLAGVLIGLATLTRNMGILLLLPIGWEWLRQHREAFVSPGPEGAGWRWRLDWCKLEPLNTLVLILQPLAMLGLWLYFQGVVLGDPFRFVAVQSWYMWDRHFAWPWQTVARAIELLFSTRDVFDSLPPGFREDKNLNDTILWLFCALLFAASAWQTVRRRLPVSYFIFLAMAFIIPLFSPSDVQPLMSIPRFYLMLFPAFIVLAQLARRWRSLHYAYLFSAVLLMALMFARFANWYWVA